MWNTAGVASTLAKWQRKLYGWKTHVMTRKAFDPFGLTTYGEVLDVGAKRFVYMALMRASVYGVIHVHSLDKVVPKLRSLYPWKRVILHYHGSDIRGRWGERRGYWSRAHALAVSTPDLLDGAPDHAVYVPNPIDTDVFRCQSPGEPGTALYVYDPSSPSISDLKWPAEVAAALGLRLHVHDRRANPVRHVDMPGLLCRYEYFIDRRWPPSLSRTALEALACGLKVVRWDGEIVVGLPEEHRPENVVKVLRDLYG